MGDIEYDFHGFPNVKERKRSMQATERLRAEFAEPYSKETWNYLIEILRSEEFREFMKESGLGEINSLSAMITFTIANKLNCSMRMLTDLDSKAGTQLLYPFRRTVINHLGLKETRNTLKELEKAAFEKDLAKSLIPKAKGGNNERK